MTSLLSLIFLSSNYTVTLVASLLMLNMLMKAKTCLLWLKCQTSSLPHIVCSVYYVTVDGTAWGILMDRCFAYSCPIKIFDFVKCSILQPCCLPRLKLHHQLAAVALIVPVIEHELKLINCKSYKS